MATLGCSDANTSCTPRTLAFSAVYCSHVYASTAANAIGGHETVINVTRAASAAVWTMGAYLALLPMAVVQCALVIYARLALEALKQPPQQPPPPAAAAPPAAPPPPPAQPPPPAAAYRRATVWSEGRAPASSQQCGHEISKLSSAQIESSTVRTVIRRS